MTLGTGKGAEQVDSAKDGLLTSGSTSPIIGLSGEMLREYVPLKPLPLKRKIYVTEEVYALLRTPDTKLMFPSVAAELVLSKFYAGYVVKTSLKSAKGCEFERLENVGEIWAACFRKPRPGWRLFGWFIQPDVLVLGVGHDRHDLAGSNYSRLAVAAQADLLKRFPSLPVFSGSTVGSYISGPLWDMDEE